MTTETEHRLLQTVIPYFNEQNFDTRFDRATHQLSKSQRFLLKMELKRLFAPCSRSIDLRGKVDTPCKPFEHLGKTHYLDPTALELFEQSLATYNSYTMGVYEEVTNAQNSYRAKQQQQDQARRDQLKNQHLRVTPTNTIEQTLPIHHSELISLSDFHQRCEERINVVTKIQTRLFNGHHLHGITSNLSVSGCKIKIPAQYQITIDQTIYINFLSIERNDEQQQIKDIAYTVLGVTQHNDMLWINCVRQHKDMVVSQFIHQFIKAQRQASTVDTSHIIEAIRSIGYQQLLINKVSGIPLFFSQHDNQYKLELALCNYDNKQILTYWQNQSNLQKIAAAFPTKRLKQLLAGSYDIHSTILYCFTHVARGKKYFYSATAQELAQTGLLDLFSSFGGAKDSWQVYQLTLCPTMNYQWKLPEVLPTHLIKQEKISTEQHKHLLKLHNVEVMAYLIPISDQTSKTLYQQRTVANRDLAQLKQFGHSDCVPEGLSLIDTNQFALRLEDRYSYQTKVFLHHNKEIVTGKTIDFSTQGMQIQLTRSIACQKQDTVNIQMPLLERSSGSEKASFISYEVMRVTPDGKTLNLKVISSSEYSDGPKQLYLLIKKNKHKLTAQVSPPPLLTKSLNLLFSNHISSLYLMIAKHGINYKIAKVVKPSDSNRLFNLFSVLSADPQWCNMAPLTKNNLFKTIFEQPIKQLSSTPQGISTEVYIQLNRGTRGNEYTYVTQIATELTTPEQHREFIEQPQGQFYAIRVAIKLTDKIDYKCVSREIIYAAKQASFKTRQLQAELDSIVAVAELIDITEEVKHRYSQ